MKQRSPVFRASLSRRRAGTILTLLVLAVTACGGNDESRQRAREEEQRVALAEVRGSRRILERRRSDLAARQRDGAALEPVARDVGARAAALNRRLVELLNQDPPQEGPPSPYQRELLEMKIAEDLILAREYIVEGGDYGAAIEIYRKALALDPQNEKLRAALARAEADRYMTAQRLATVKKGMVESEVRALLGPPHPREIRRYPERQVVVWFYPRADGGQAAVFFAERPEGNVVYQLDPDVNVERSAARSAPGARS